MRSIENVSRRGFLKGVIGTGPLWLPFDMLRRFFRITWHRMDRLSRPGALHRMCLWELKRTGRCTLSRIVGNGHVIRTTLPLSWQMNWTPIGTE